MMPKQQRVCITGMGLITPSGLEPISFWNNVVEGKNSVRKIDRIPLQNYPVQIAGQLDGFNAEEHLPRRFLIKTDTFIHYAWTATNLALKDAQLNLSDYDPYDIGIWFGNNAGGWDICERGLFELFREGPEFVNPWQATAWFLTAPQGYVSIGHHISGMSKSFVCDRASSASALYFAHKAIQMGHNQIAITGGTEAPVNAFALTCYYETGQLASSVDDCTAYRPFDAERSGGVLGEGSVVLILESLEHAKARNAQIYGEIMSATITTDFDAKDHQQLVRAQKQALKRADITPTDIGVIFAEGAGTYDSDWAEAAAIQETFADNPNVPVTCPKAGFGHLYGASSAADLACGLLAASHKTIPPTPNVQQLQAGMQIRVPLISEQASFDYFMLESRSREGNNVCFVVKTSSF